MRRIRQARRWAGIWTAVAAAILLLDFLNVCTAAADTDGTGPGTLTISLGWDTSRQEATLTETYAYALGPASEALAQTRKGLGNAFPLDVVIDRAGGLAFDGWTYRPLTVTQRSPDASALLEESTTYYLPRTSGLQTLTMTVGALPPPLHDAGMPSVWTVRLVDKGWSTEKVSGALQSQVPHEVVWRTTQSSAPVRVTVSRTVRTTLPAMERHQTRGEIVASLTAGILALGLLALFTVSRLKSPGARARWFAVVAVLTAVSCAATTVPHRGEDLTVRGSVVSWSRFPRPEELWMPLPALGLWIWYALPVLGWWITSRLAAGRLPRFRDRLLAAAAPVAAAVLLIVAGIRPNPGMWAVLGCVVCMSLAVGALTSAAPPGSTPHRWGPTAATAVAVLGLVLSLSQASVFDEEPAYPAVESGMLLLTWPAAAWCTSLLGTAAGRTPSRSAKGGVFLALWVLTVGPYLVAYANARRGTAFNDYSMPFFVGYTGYPFLVMAMAFFVLAVVYLLRTGTARGGGRAVEPCGMALVVWAAAVCMGNPSLRSLATWGSALAVLWAASSWFLLVPAGALDRTAALRRVSRRAHARLMGGWIRTQLLWDARSDFQRAARASFADGTLTRTEFGRRWEELDVPGVDRDPEGRLVRAKRSALGSAAGIPPRVAGLVGAAAAQALALPWATYKLVGGQTLGADPVMPFHLHDAALLLRFGHWAVYGFVFGYFYVGVRGATPVAKATALLAVVLPIEVLPMLALTIDPQYTRAPLWSSAAVGCGGAAGQAVVVCMGLGLLWERRLSRAAAMKWSQVRNFRRLSSITVPAGTVLVAGATAFATAVAGTWVHQDQAPLPSPTAVPTSVAGAAQPGS